MNPKTQEIIERDELIAAAKDLISSAMDQISEAVSNIKEAERNLKDAGLEFIADRLEFIADRLMSYPRSHIETSIDHNHAWLDRSTTLSDILEEIDESEMEAEA